MSSRRATTSVAVAAMVAVALSGSAGARSRAAGAALPPTGSLTVATAIAPNPTFFGDPISAVVTITLDARVIVPGSVQFTPSFAPYGISGVPRESSTDIGPEQTTVYRYPLLCVTDGCLPGVKPIGVQFPQLVVSARTTAAAGNAAVRTTAPWQAEVVNSRLTRFDRTHSVPRFRWPTTMPTPHYAVSASLLRWLLTAAGALLTITAVYLIGFELVALRARLRRGPPRLSPLEEALVFTRQAATRDDPTDRRKAIGLLASTLEAEGHSDLASSTEAVAWSEPPPSGAQATSVADEVEASLTAGEA